MPVKPRKRKYWKRSKLPFKKKVLAAARAAFDPRGCRRVFCDLSLPYLLELTYKTKEKRIGFGLRAAMPKETE